MKKQMISIEVRKDLIARMKKIKKEEGIPLTCQVEYALVNYFSRKKFRVK